MGAAAKERKAKQAAAREYQKALRKIEPIENFGSVDSNSMRKLDEALGSNLDARTKHMLRKADSQAKQINAAERKDPRLQESVKRFNDRYAVLKEQLQGNAVTRYVVRKKEEPQMGMGGLTSRGAAPKSLVDVAQSIPKRGSGFDSTFATSEEAGVAAQERSAVSAQAPKKFGLLGLTNAKPAQYETATVTYAPLQNANQRTLNSMRAAYEDMDAVSKDINAAPTTAMREAYASIANKIAGRAEKLADEASTPQASSLLKTAVMPGGPAVGKVRY